MSDSDDPQQTLQLDSKEEQVTAPAKKTARKTAARKTAAKKTARKTARKTATNAPEEPAEQASAPEQPAAEQGSREGDAEAAAPVKRARRNRKTPVAAVPEPQKSDPERPESQMTPSAPRSPAVPQIRVPKLDEEIPQYYSSDDDVDDSSDSRNGSHEDEGASGGPGKTAQERRMERRQARLAEAESEVADVSEQSEQADGEDRQERDNRREDRRGRDDRRDRDFRRDRNDNRQREDGRGRDNRRDERSQDSRRDDRSQEDRRDDRQRDDRRENRQRQDRNKPQQDRGPRPDRGGPQGGNNQQNKKKKKKKAGAQQQQRRGRADFFGAEEGVSIEVGDLPDFELLKDLEAAEKLALEHRDGGDPVDLNALFAMPLLELAELARKTFDVAIEGAPVRQQVIEQVLQKAFELKRAIYVEGVVETTADGYGLLTYTIDSYRIKPLNTFISKQMMRRFGLKRGHIVRAQIHPPRPEKEQPPQNSGESLDEEGDDSDDFDGLMTQPAQGAKETCPFVLRIETIMGRDPAENLNVTPFEDLVPYYPTERLLLETEPGVKWDNISMRVVDLLTPIGKGQRGLIVAPPRTGKTILQQGIANAIMRNNPESHLIILLVDERPEEVTDFRRQIGAGGEVVASTFDEVAESHVHAAEMVIEKARRMVEVGKDVIILLDSITRLARAYNALAANSGKILSGGVEATALQKPKRFFGSARNIEGGGSLTILGTALVETGSRMDEVIFEEFKGTGNQEIHLDRELVNKRIFPSINLERSGTRKEELLYHPDELLKVYGLRRAMKGVPSTEAMEMLINRIKKTKTNVEFLMNLNR